VLVTRINRFFGTSFTSMPCKYDGLKTSNILVTCVDSAAARLEISKYRIENAGQHPTDKQYYWMDIGNLQQTGQVILGTNGKITQRAARLLNAVSSLPNVVQAFPQLKKVKEADQGPSCSMAEALDRQDLFINSVLAEFAGNLLWKLLRKGLIEYRGCYVNLETLTVNPIKI
ncbi:MAG: PRTRC system ThiF family protein, partial [Bacteroidota bacterium]|nr:PRTRC system ThiF family protein [Bacteroidota bacterium]